MTKIIVAIIHGAGLHTRQNSGGDDMQRMSEKLKDKVGDLFRENNHGNISDIIFKPIYWDEESHLHRREMELKDTMRGNSVRFESLLSIDGIGSLREFLFDTIGDIASYQPVSNKDKPYPYLEVFDTYTAIHTVIAQNLKKFAHDYGADSRLVLIGHSLGSIIASNYVYDWRHDNRNHRLVHVNVQSVIGKNPSPLENLETLDLFVTMGSPMALWSLRYEKFDSPIHVDTWYNIFDKDDVLAYPLEPLLGKEIVEDIRINAGGLISSATPLSHLGYWQDDDVIKRIGESLANLWAKYNSV